MLVDNWGRHFTGLIASGVYTTVITYVPPINQTLRLTFVQASCFHGTAMLGFRVLRNAVSLFEVFGINNLDTIKLDNYTDLILTGESVNIQLFQNSGGDLWMQANAKGYEDMRY